MQLIYTAQEMFFFAVIIYEMLLLLYIVTIYGPLTC
jgi:hypothetical protein